MKKLSEHKKIIKAIVWAELEKLRMGKNQFIEFEWGKKRFKIKRVV